jgi:hypothetical protein
MIKIGIRAEMIIEFGMGVKNDNGRAKMIMENDMCVK